MTQKTKQIAEIILKEIDSKNRIDAYDYSCELGIDLQIVIGAVKSLEALGDVVHIEQTQIERWELTKEGFEVISTNSHEFLVYNAVHPKDGILQSDLMPSVPNAKLGLDKAISNGWLKINKTAAGERKVFRQIPVVTDTVKDDLLSIKRGQSLSIEKLKELKKRKLISNVVLKSPIVTKGSSFSTRLDKLDAEITTEMIQSGSWRGKQFKSYNYNSFGAPLMCGHFHPLMKVRTEIRQIFLEMGFSEMPTNNFIESSFWNFDALFQPQQHPARDAHDTFFLKDPQYTTKLPEEYVEQVKMAHETGGGCDSTGYQYTWKLNEAQKNILRTHTTAVSARMLYNLGKQQEFTPVKYFSIDRVFRNETLDATHLAEFHQIEGLVADYDLTLGDLMGCLHSFFSKMGIDRLKFKPAYNPYTEPSMEVFSYHSGLKKWVEIGNSGVFRPEMLLPMHLPENVSVIAWGLSLERPTMIKYGLNNIRELVGHKVNLEMVYKNSICRLEK